jgi:tRNA threonylcarbamoyladenosine biosynthesis protein TsaB
MLLAIDTATHIAGIALYDANGPRGMLQWHTERNHTVELMPNVVRLLADAGAQATDLAAIAIAIGPGSYTGLRIGLSVAKGFCFATGAALVAVPTLDISAYSYAVRPSELCAILQSGRGRLAARYYRAEQAEWQPQGEPFYGRAAELADACAGRTVFFCGEVDPDTENALRERLGASVTFVPDTERARDPRVLARLGWARWQAEQTEIVERLAPDYGQQLSNQAVA